MEERNEITNLAEKLGFEAEAEEMTWYLWMCDCQKWLRDKNEMIVSIENDYDRQGEYNRGYLISINGKTRWDKDNDVFESYEGALEIALKEALQLIKSK